MLSVKLPVAVAVLVVTVRVELPPGVTDAGEKDVVAPDGAPVRLRAIELAKPPTALVLTV